MWVRSEVWFTRDCQPLGKRELQEVYVNTDSWAAPFKILIIFLAEDPEVSSKCFSHKHLLTYFWKQCTAGQSLAAPTGNSKWSERLWSTQSLLDSLDVSLPGLAASSVSSGQCESTGTLVHKVLSISRWWQQSTQPSWGPFWVRACKTLQVAVHEGGPVSSL